MSSKRKTFYLNSDKDKPITAGGVILFRIIKNDIELLLADTRGTFEDLGGCVDKLDKDILTTVAREAFEESNELLNKRKIKSRLKAETPVYVEKMKYVVYVIEANDDEKKLASGDFGSIEHHDQIERTIKWIPLSILIIPEIFRDKLNWRIKNRKIFDKIKEKKEDKKINSNLFNSDSDKRENIIKKKVKSEDTLKKKVKSTKT